MAYLTVFLFALLVIAQTVTVFSRRVDFEDFNAQIGNGNQFSPERPTTNLRPAGTTTTTAPPQFTNCVNACPSTSQYAPVCGSDSVSYYNIQKLICAQNCGLRIRQVHVGTCRPSAGGK